MIYSMIRGVLLDIAGVLYDGDMAIEGSAEAVRRLRKTGLDIRFITNSTRNPRRVIISKLSRLGFDVSARELFTPAAAAIEILSKKGHRAHLMTHPSLREDFSDLKAESSKCTVVVGDAAEHFTYENLNNAFRQLSSGAKLMALANNRTFNDSDGELSMDTGAFVSALSFASGVKADVVGKPAPAFFQAALDSMGVSAADTVMFGDDAESDVAGALSAGIGTAVLLKTGKYRAGAENDVDPVPSLLADNLSSAVDRLLF